MKYRRMILVIIFAAGTALGMWSNTHKAQADAAAVDSARSLAPLIEFMWKDNAAGVAAKAFLPHLRK